MANISSLELLNHDVATDWRGTGDAPSYRNTGVDLQVDMEYVRLGGSHASP